MRGETSTAKSQEGRHKEKREKLIKKLPYGGMGASGETSPSIRIVKDQSGTCLGLWHKKSVWCSMMSKELMEMSCLSHSI